ncbi:MAG: propanediol utilization protein [Elusimicrobia bacterium GWC2_51_8]|nr:MAG: propanediol utilization protein [Elusimicrobia bacterium GWA2_51_34]OGR57657.1 MAG: propanediol utilization protein [Elusimicrobia bacterium GWC2_51_8]OGR88300.1 MAG: propanediol utilization protein [Elusimicrobia bacterium GWF2_52_66]HAF95923.1 propanediol utilization protein [Elusimicrobiota bacterium]HCE98033.1 propanediol utilization protein [Elusimicrobiota bacterium]
MNNSIGGVELSSVAKGFETADAMLKMADVELLLSRSVCPGKYIVLVAGTVADVNAAVEAGANMAAHALVDSFAIPNIHPDVFPAIAGTVPADELESLGVIEAFSVSALIEAADAAVKSASVKLLEIRLAMALGGKAFVTLTGTVAAAQTAVSAGAAVVAKKGLLVEKVVIPNPRKELLKELI